MIFKKIQGGCGTLKSAMIIVIDINILPDGIQGRREVSHVLVDRDGGGDQEGGEEGDQEECHPYS